MTFLVSGCHSWPFLALFAGLECFFHSHFSLPHHHSSFLRLLLSCSDPWFLTSPYLCNYQIAIICYLPSLLNWNSTWSGLKISTFLSIYRSLPLSVFLSTPFLLLFIVIIFRQSSCASQAGLKTLNTLPQPLSHSPQFWIFRAILSTPRVRPRSHHSLFLKLP